MNWMMAATSKVMKASLLILSSLLWASCSKLNVPRVLLPTCDSTVVNFTLEVSEGGCYKWQSTRPGVAQVVMLDVHPTRDCSTRAVVMAVSKQPVHQTSLVIAYDEATGQRLHCDVIVNVIHSLEIVRTTAELYLDDAPELVVVHAKDKNGDSFSSLDGMNFHWTLVTDKESQDVIDASTILRIVPFSKSKYEAPQCIKESEEKGQSGFMVLLEGKTTGSAKISVKILDSAYTNVASEEVTLVVVANMMLNPAYDVHLIPGATIHYEVELVKQGKAHQIEMPSDQFYLVVKTPEVVSLDVHSNNITALEYGSTEVILKDRNMIAKQPLREPIAGIHVVEADHLVMTIYPFENSLLEIGRKYQLIFNVYDSKNNRIHPTDNLRIVVQFPEDYFQLIDSTPNGTYHEVIPVTRGIATITADVKPLTQENRREIVLKETLEICEPVEIQPSMIVLPWDPMMRPSNNVVLKAVGGGDSEYTWSTSDPQIVSINQKGELTIYALGTVNITAASLRNPHLTSDAKVAVMPVVDLKILPATVETELDKTVHLPIALYGDTSILPHTKSYEEKQIAFTDCRRLSFKVEVMDPKKFEYVPESNFLSELGCITLVFHARSVGSSNVIVTYYNGEMELKTSTLIASFNPLRAVTSDKVVLALGSSKQIAFEGGPRVWILKPDDHYRKVSVVDDAVASLITLENHECTSKDLHTFEVTCLTSGKTLIELNVGNKPSPGLPHPALSNYSMEMICAIPSSLFLEPKVKRPALSQHSCARDVHKIPVQSYNNIAITVTMTDSEGNNFDNFTSLLLEWQLSNTELASLPNVVHLEYDSIDSGCHLIITDTYQKIIFNGQEGPLRIKAILVGYTSVKRNDKVGLPTEVFNVLDLELVGDAVIAPNKISVFNHPANEVILQIQKGSGQFDVNPQGNQMARIKYNTKNHTIHLYPLKDGSFTVTVHDLCLEVKEPAISFVRVTGIKKIEVHMMDKVELNKELEATVHLLDPEDQCLPENVATLTHLHPVPGANIVNMKPQSAFSKSSCGTVFILQGIAVGHTTITFQADVKHGSVGVTTVSSDLIPVQVFPPLRIHPVNVTLIHGAVFQITSSGGPQPQSNIEFSVQDTGIAKVDSSGIIEAHKLGNTEVVARAIGPHPETGHTVIYTKDETNLAVVQLAAIRILAPLTRMKVGSQMMVHVVGVNEHETPFSFATAYPSLLYEWNSNDKETVIIQPVFHVSSSRNNFVMRVTAKRPGQAMISVKVKAEKDVGQIKGGLLLHDTLQIQVFDALSIIKPEMDKDSLLITPSSKLLLKTNRELLVPVSYIVIDNTESNNLDPCITVESNGLLHSGPRSCQATVLIMAHEDFGFNQSVNILVQVKPVSHIVLATLKLLHIKETGLTKFPVGGVMNLEITFHDNVGNTFHATNVVLHYRPSRYDILEMIPDRQNTTYTLKSLKAGQTVIKFWSSRNPRIETYFSLSAGDVIKPSNAFATVGDVLCFNTHLQHIEGKLGNWHTDNPSVIIIDSKTGVSVITNTGSASIYYTLSNEVVLRTDIIANPIAAVGVSTHHQFITNAWEKKVYDFFITLHGIQQPKNVNLIGSNCSSIFNYSWTSNNLPFACSASFTADNVEVFIHDMFEVTAIFIPNSGLYSCRLTSKPIPSNLKLKLSTIQTHIAITAKTLAQRQQTSVISKPVDLPFIPGFHILISEINLSSLQPVSFLPISAIDDVFSHVLIIPSDPSVLEVRSAEQDSTMRNIRRFPIHLQDGCWEPGDANFELNVTWDFDEETIVVPVFVKFIELASDKCSSYSRESTGWSRMLYAATDHYQNIFLIILSVAGTIVAILIGYWSMFGQSYATNALVDGNSSGSRSFLIRPGGPTHSSKDGLSPPGRSILWSENLPMHGSPYSPPSPRSASLQSSPRPL